VAVHFRFNAWGEKFAPWDRDALVGGEIARQLGDEVISAPIVLEGGSIACDGDGLLLATEQCLLHPNRNPSLAREEIEEVLRQFLGIERLQWLGQGLLEDRDTDGHVDLIASFVGPRRVLLQSVNREDPNYENCLENRGRLLDAGVEVIDLPFLPRCDVAGETVAVSYLNLYVCNGAVIVPVCGAASDAEALEIIAGAYPGREVIALAGAVLAYGGGGPHCITQQVPVRDA
jgi:agmatine deiminase